MENAKMEERLRTLRKTIEKEKEERRLVDNLLFIGEYLSRGIKTVF